MKKFLNFAFALVLLFSISISAPGLARAQGFVGDFPDMDQLQEIAECIRAGQAELKSLKASGKISDANAEELNKILGDLVEDRYKVGGCQSPGVYGCVRTLLRPLGVSIHVTSNFFNLTSAVETNLATSRHFQEKIVELSREVQKTTDRSLKEQKTLEMVKWQNALMNQPTYAEIKEQLRQARLQQLSVLIHEWKHKQFKGLIDSGRPDPEAYALQLKWLRFFRVDEKSNFVRNVQNQVTQIRPSAQPAVQAVQKANPRYENCIKGQQKIYDDYVAWSKKVGTKDYWSLFRCGPVGTNWQEYPEKICCDTYQPREDWDGLQHCGWKYKLDKEKIALDKKAAECRKKFPN